MIQKQATPQADLSGSPKVLFSLDLSFHSRESTERAARPPQPDCCLKSFDHEKLAHAW